MTPETAPIFDELVAELGDPFAPPTPVKRRRTRAAQPKKAA